MAGVGDLVEEQSVAELGVLAVRVEDRVGEVCLPEFTGGDRSGEPGVVVLAVELEHPTRHRDRHPNRGASRGELSHERVEPFPGSWACDR